MKVCGDENPCTDDGCDPKTGCTHVPNADPCSDGSVCTVGDTCSGGGCKPGPALDCDDHLACTTDSCHPVAGCGHVPVADGTGCVQAGCTDLVFAPAHTCVAGVCTSGGASRDCKDGNECTADYCLLPDGGCLNVVLEDGTACAPSSCNGLVWTRPSTCAAGTCTLRGIQNCDDALACTSDACDASAGCSHAVEAGKCLIAGTCYAEGASGGKCRECRPSSGNAGWTYVPGKTCDDGKACTRDDRCAAGGSGDGDCAGTAYSCDDGLACTKDVCDGLGGCPNTLLAGYCLIGGACYGSGQPNPQQPCQVCDPTKSGTAWTGKADGTRCIDGACNGLAYTAPTTCQAGLCVAGGGTSSCDDGHACTNDSCSVASGCANVLKAGHCLIPGQGCVANGAANPANPCQACNTSRSTTAWSSLADGSTCIAANCSSLLFTAARTCVAGQCTGGGASVNCDDERTCTNDTCSATTGCANALSAGNCLISGTCYAAGIPNPGNACQACTPATSTSTWSSVANGTSCGTGGQVCFSGACCTPQCAGYACGDDSCGGSCGTCQTGYSCVSHQCSQTSNKVLLLTDTASTNASLAAGLNAAGLVTTHVSGGITSYTGSPAASGFAVVILATGGSYSTDMSSAGQTSIATAAASGNTGVVFFEWSSYHTYNYRWQSLKNLLLLAWRSDSSGSTMTFTSTTSHPIWTGLPSSFTTVPSIYYSIGATIVNGGSSIATSTQAGGPAVIVRDTGGGRVVHFANATHNSAGTSVWGDANLMKLVSNAAKWAAKLL
jgi:hypothetical protein